MAEKEGFRFGSIGHRANRTSYVLYRASQGAFTPVTPNPSRDEQVLFGDAIEFRYWDVALDTSDSHGIMDTKVTTTSYALFYLDGEQLQMDSGPYPLGGIPTRGGRGDGSTATLEPNPDYHERHLPDPMIVEAVMTVGGGRMA